MKILVIGGAGTIGRAAAEPRPPRHEVIAVGHRGGERTVDIGRPESIEELYDTVGRIDAVVSCAGRGAFGPLGQLSDADFALSLSNKLMGQVNVVRLGI